MGRTFSKIKIEIMENNIKELINQLSGIETVFYIMELTKQKNIEEIHHINCCIQPTKGPVYTLLNSFNFEKSVKGFKYWSKIIHRLKN